MIVKMYFAKSRSCCCLICLINFGWSEGRGWNCSSIRCVLLKNIRKIRRMRKQSIPGLPSFRGWPGIEASVLQAERDYNQDRVGHFAFLQTCYTNCICLTDSAIITQVIQESADVSLRGVRDEVLYNVYSGARVTYHTYIIYKLPLSLNKPLTDGKAVPL